MIRATHSLNQALAALALTVPLAAAQAGNVTASASLNPVGQVSNSNAGASASAYWPGAANASAGATATRTVVTGFSNGSGILPPELYGSSGLASSSYVLWNPTAGIALDIPTALALTLRFDFLVSGSTTSGGPQLSNGSTSYGAQISSSLVVSNSAFINITSSDLGSIVNGDSNLLGAYSRSFSLLHEAADSGVLGLEFSTGASATGNSFGSLQLVGVALAGGTAPASGLSIRLAETGQLIPVVAAIPEPSTWALWLAGAAAVVGVARRRAPSRAEDRL